MKASILCLALLSATGTASAFGSHHVFDMQSEPGEAKTEFVIRVSHAMQEFTAETGHETCGSLAVNTAGDWSIRAMTSREELACEWRMSDTVDGYTETDESVHSHPDVATLQPRGFNAKNRHLAKLHRGTQAGGCNPSPHDVVTGAGYLVACGRVVYYTTAGAVTAVSSL